MSQVVITKDHYKSARDATLAEEKQIDISSAIRKNWKRRQLLNQNILSVILGAVIAPIVLAWSLLIGGFAFAFTLSLGILRFLGTILPIGRRGKLT